MSTTPNECVPFEELAEGLEPDCHQCNKRCRKMPTVGRIGKMWIVKCGCSRIDHAEAPMAVLLWNGFNPIRRITPTAKLEQLRELNRRIKDGQ